MNIRYSIEVRDLYLYLDGEGTEASLEENVEIRRLILNACKEHQRRRVLIDDRKVIYTASVISLYMLAKQYAEVDRQRFIQRAALIANAAYRNDNQFFEDTMRNRNVNLRLFYDIEEA